MHWIWWIVSVVAFAVGWLVRQLYGAGIIARLEAEKLALETEAQGLRDKTAAWVGGRATRL